jgi:mono/diheme cytochrome c family protein
MTKRTHLLHLVALGLLGVAVLGLTLITLVTVSRGLWSLPPAEASEESRSDNPLFQTTPISGQQLFEQRCSPCHGIGGVGGEIGPAFTDRLVLPPEYVLNRVRTGPADMYAFTEAEVTDADIIAIAEYLQNEVAGTQVPVLTEAERPVAKALYLTYCTECHGSLGLGRQERGPAINIWPPMGISRIIKGGLLPLPDMPRLSVTPDELRLIAAYVQSLSKPQ